MKPETRYRCEKCESLYLNENEAMRCEHNHKIPVEIVNERYGKSSMYPETLTISFSNGLSQIYKLVVF